MSMHDYDPDEPWQAHACEYAHTNKFHVTNAATGVELPLFDTMAEAEAAADSLNTNTSRLPRYFVNSALITQTGEHMVIDSFDGCVKLVTADYEEAKAAVNKWNEETRV